MCGVKIPACLNYLFPGPIIQGHTATRDETNRWDRHQHQCFCHLALLNYTKTEINVIYENIALKIVAQLSQLSCNWLQLALTLSKVFYKVISDNNNNKRRFFANKQYHMKETAREVIFDCRPYTRSGFNRLSKTEFQ